MYYKIIIISLLFICCNNFKKIDRQATIEPISIYSGLDFRLDPEINFRKKIKSCKNCKIILKRDEWFINPDSVGYAKIEFDDQTDMLFHVIQVPDPRIIIGPRKFQGTLKQQLEDDIINIYLNVFYNGKLDNGKLDNEKLYDTAPKYEIFFFYVEKFNNKNEIIFSNFNGGEIFSPINEKEFRNIKSGEKILFYDIHVQFPDGSIKKFNLDTIKID